MAKRAKLKIGIVCPYNIFRHGGVQETIFAHRQVLCQRGHQVLIISPRPLSFRGQAPEYIRLIGMSTDLNYPFKTKADISIKVGQAEIKRLLDQERFDILHFHEPWVPIFPRQLLNLSRAVNIGTFHAKWPEKLIYRTFGKAIKPYAKSIIKDLDYLVAASEPASHYVNELVNGKVPIIYNGIDLQRFNPDRVKPLPDFEDGKRNILYLNRLEKRKGPDLLLYAYELLKNQEPDVRLIMASDGDMRRKLEDYVSLYRIKDVIFTGFVDNETKVRLYKTADLYCAPAPYGEGFGIVLLEAMAMGVPYVAGNNAGYRYASADRAEQYLVDPYKSEIFARKLSLMLKDEALRQDYRQWAAARIRRFDYEVIVSQYEELYYKLIKDETRASA